MDKRIATNLTLHPEVRTRLDKLAKEKRITRSSLVNQLLAEALLTESQAEETEAEKREAEPALSRS